MKKKKSKLLVVVVVIIVIAIIGVAMGSDDDSGDSGSKVTNENIQSDDSYDERIDYVKNGYPQLIPDITYEEAYDNFFENPTWRYFDSTEGDEVVEFAGECRYSEDGNVDEIEENNAKVYIQFVLDEDEFELAYLKLNVDGKDVETDETDKLTFIYQPFATYSKDVLGKPLSKKVRKSFEELLESMQLDGLDE